MHSPSSDGKHGDQKDQRTITLDYRDMRITENEIRNQNKEVEVPILTSSGSTGKVRILTQADFDRLYHSFLLIGELFIVES
jgi:hypothetical protein